MYSLTISTGDRSRLDNPPELRHNYNLVNQPFKQVWQIETQQLVARWFQPTQHLCRQRWKKLAWICPHCTWSCHENNAMQCSKPTLSSTRAGKEFPLTVTAASAAPLLLLVDQSLDQILKLYQSKDHTFSVFLHLLPSLSTNIWIKFYFFPDSPAPFQSASLWFFCSRLPPEWWCSMRLLSGDSATKK